MVTSKPANGGVAGTSGFYAFRSILSTRFRLALQQQVLFLSNKQSVRDVHDEAPLAEAITKLYEDRGSQLPDGLLAALGIALDQLQDRAVAASLVLPSQGTELGRGMTDPDPFEPSRLIAVCIAHNNSGSLVLLCPKSRD
jgi:hypothetical protein